MNQALLEAFEDELLKIAGVPKGLVAAAKKGGNSYAYNRAFAHDIGKVNATWGKDLRPSRVEFGKNRRLASREALQEKRANAGPWGHAAEVAGLGTLAAPHIYNAVTGKKATHKTERNTELAGLGILAAPSVKALLTKRANVNPSAFTGRAAAKLFGGGGTKTLADTARRAAPSGEKLLEQIRKAKASYGKTPSLEKNISNFTPSTGGGSSWKTNRGSIPL
jgi:hypothetical protein